MLALSHKTADDVSPALPAFGSELMPRSVFSISVSTRPLRFEEIEKETLGDLSLGRPLLILHGGNDSLTGFRELAKTLSKQRPVILFNQRGSGLTPNPGDHMGQWILKQDLSTLVDGLNLKSFDLLGHCAGGMVALVYAAENPERVHSLILEDVSGIPVPVDHNHMIGKRTKVIQFLKTLPASFSDTEAYKEALQPLIAGKPEKLLRGILKKSLARGPNGNDIYLPQRAAAVEELVMESRLRDISAEYARYKGPLLMLKAEEESEHFLEIHIPNVLQARPDAEIVRIPGSTHLIHEDQPEHWIQAVEDFLRAQRN